MTPNLEKQSFGDLLRFFRGQTIDRHNGKPLSQEMFGFRVSEMSGLHITRNTVNNWENAKSYLDAGQDRPLLIAVVTTLFKYSGIRTIADANQLLEAGGFKMLNGKEAVSINPEWVSHLEQPDTKGIDQSLSASPTFNQTLAASPSIAIKIENQEPIPVVIHAPKAIEHVNAFTQVSIAITNFLARMFFAILEAIPDWLTSTRSSRFHDHLIEAKRKEFTLIDPNCGNQPIDLKQQRLKISAAFGSYFTGLLEKEYNYFPIPGQLDLSLPSTAPDLEAFQQIYWSMQHARGPEVILIAAEGGMGKSTLAAKIIRCLYSENAVDLLLGDSAKSQIVNPLTGEILEQQAEFDDLNSFLFKVSSQLGIEYSSGESNRQLAIRKIKDRLEGRRTIVVMDNLESVQNGTDLLNTFQQLAGRDTRLLVTTRTTSKITHQTAGIFLIRLNPIRDEQIAEGFLRWHVNANIASHQALGKILPDLSDKENLRRLIDKTGGIPLLMQLILSDIARSSWSRLEKLPTLFGKELLNFLYQERWSELKQLGRDGENACAILFHILEQSHRGPIRYENLIKWGKTTRGLDSPDKPLEILQERFLIVNNDLKQGNFSVFPSLSEFLQTQQSLGYHESESGS